MIVKPSIGFTTTDSDAQLVTDTQTILTAMTGNPSYATPSPTLAAVTTALNDFTTALATAAYGGTNLTAIKNVKREALSALLRHLASYVHVTCNRDYTVLLGSGFPTQKPARTPAGILPAPAAPTLTQGGRSGLLNASTPPVANGYAYQWRLALATAPDTYLQEVFTTAASNAFDGLTPGQSYVVDVNVLGSAGPSDWSDIAQLMVI